MDIKNSSNLSEDEQNFDSEDNNDSFSIINALNIYIPMFKFEICYYSESYGIFLRENKFPFRNISIFNHFDRKEYEIRSEISKSSGNTEIFFSKKGIKDKNDIISLTKRVILGMDQMQNILDKLRMFKN